MLIAPLSQYFGPEHLTAYRALYARWLEDAAIEGFERPPLEGLDHAAAR